MVIKLRPFIHILLATSLSFAFTGVSNIFLPEIALAQVPPTAPPLNEGQKLFTEAKVCYQGKQYQKAAELFWQAITKGNGGAKVWLYCAHSYAASGNYSKARKIYGDLIRAHKGTPEARAAKKYKSQIGSKKDKLVEDPKNIIKTLPPPEPNSALANGVKLFRKKDYDGAATAINNHLKKSPGDARGYYYLALVNHYKGKTPAAILNYRKVVTLSPDSNLAIKSKLILEKVDPGFKASSNKKSKGVKRLKRGTFESGLITKINVIPPHKEYPHPRVRKASIETIKDVCRRLPKTISQRLYDGGATINIAPNMLDKWPNGLLDKNKEKPELFCFEEPSRTYGNDAYIYEANMHRSSRNLMTPYTQAQIRHATLFELSTVLIHMDGNFATNDKNVEKLYLSEIKRVSGNDKTVLRDHIIPARGGLQTTCSEITAGLLGSRDRRSVLAMKNFPKTTKWIKIRLGL